MIVVLLDGSVVCTGPDWMKHHFIDDVLERFPGKSFDVLEVNK